MFRCVHVIVSRRASCVVLHPPFPLVPFPSRAPARRHYTTGEAQGAAQVFQNVLARDKLVRGIFPSAPPGFPPEGKLVGWLLAGAHSIFGAGHFIHSHSFHCPVFLAQNQWWVSGAC